MYVYINQYGEGVGLIHVHLTETPKKVFFIKKTIQ